MTFAEALQVVMDEKGLSQADICRATGLSDAYVSMLVSGKVRDPKWSRAELVIRALGVTLDEFSLIKSSDE